MIIHPNGKESVSIFNTLKNYKDCSLIQVTILTGRKHQIRVQCASLNHPILNDPLYGGKKLIIQDFYFKVIIFNLMM